MKIKTFLKEQAGKETTLFKKSRHPLSFKPFFVYQGLAVFVLLFVIASFFIPQHKFNQTAIIKTATTNQLSANVAGQPTQWSVLVSKSSITKDSYLAKLPKNAKNIKVTTISATQAEQLVSQPPLAVSIDLKQKKSIAIANQPKSFFAASLLDSISKFFAASIDEGVQAIVDAVNPDITQTSDATVVDLSSQAPAETAPEVVPTETPAEPALEVVPAPAEQTPTPSDVVQVNYETPAPTISEQTTDTGKLVTVSSSVGTIDCETLNPANKATSAPAGLLNGFTNAFKSITKFFTADLEQAASDAVQTIIDQIIPPAETPAPVETPVVEPLPVETPAGTCSGGSASPAG